MLIQAGSGQTHSSEHEGRSRRYPRHIHRQLLLTSAFRLVGRLDCSVFFVDLGGQVLLQLFEEGPELLLPFDRVFRWILVGPLAHLLWRRGLYLLQEGILLSGYLVYRRNRVDLSRDHHRGLGDHSNDGDPDEEQDQQAVGGVTRARRDKEAEGEEHRKVEKEQKKDEAQPCPVLAGEIDIRVNNENQKTQQKRDDQWNE